MPEITNEECTCRGTSAVAELWGGREARLFARDCAAAAAASAAPAAAWAAAESAAAAWAAEAAERDWQVKRLREVCAEVDAAQPQED